MGRGVTGDTEMGISRVWVADVCVGDGAGPSRLGGCCLNLQETESTPALQHGKAAAVREPAPQLCRWCVFLD